MNITKGIVPYSMIKIAIEGMRNPFESYDKSDSFWTWNDGEAIYQIGKEDIKLAQSLLKSPYSSDHKFMRQIPVGVEISAPLYWWKEMDQYKIGTVTDSCSTMHKLSSTELSMDSFELFDYHEDKAGEMPKHIVQWLEELRGEYNKTKDIEIWKEIIRWLPCGYLQKRTYTCNYENLRNIYFQRRNHKLLEWKIFINWMDNLPYVNELIKYEENK